MRALNDFSIKVAFLRSYLDVKILMNLSYSEWASEIDIRQYMNSAAHKEIVRHARSLEGTTAVVKLYELVE